MRNREVYFNSNQVCKYLGISRVTLWRYRKEKAFPLTLKWKGRLYWYKTDIEKWGETLFEAA